MPRDRDKIYPDPDFLSEETVKIPIARVPRIRSTIPTLRVVAGPDMLKFVALEPGGSITIGRDEGCDLSLSDASASRQHAQVTYDLFQGVEIQDLNSTNGTAVNDHPIQRKGLQAGDHVEIGAVSLRMDLLDRDEVDHLERVQRRLQAANRDPLTGLRTRAFLQDGLAALVEQYAMAGAPFSAMFIDVDHFKKINDTYGHAVGDHVLKSIARLIAYGVRDSDPCVRYGGEEIVVFLPMSDEDNALKIGERIRQSVARHDWSRTVAGLEVTISIGVAQREPGEESADWMDRADKAMYAAKQAGRNQSRLFSSLAG